MQFNDLGAVVFLCAWLALPAQGDSIVTSGSFQPFPPVLSEHGLPTAPYWDNLSADGPQRNIGFYLTGSTSFPNSPGLSNPPYLGAGIYPVDFSFSSTGPIVITMLLASTANQDEFGYYNANSPGQMIPLLTTSTPLMTTIQFTPIFPSYGFYMRYLPGTPGLLGFTDVYRSQSSLNTGAEANALRGMTPHQHFALFSGGGTYYVGMTDRWGTSPGLAATPGVNEMLGDYQDMVVRIQAVPEPGFGVLIAFSAWLAARLAGRRR